MKLELLSASNFLVHLVRLAKRNVSESQLQKFRESLIDVLRRRYRDHWFPDKPFKGSGYRCLRINGRMDPIIGQAGNECGLPSAFLHSVFPSELTMWIDPLEVSYRIGENGNICIIYEYAEGGTEWMPASLRKKKKRDQPEHPPPMLKMKTKDSPPPTTALPPLCNKLFPPPPTITTANLRMDFLLDPRGQVSIEELAALVSS